jgi:putative RecB family exonuclease
VVDYKTARSPAPGFEQRALFQMRFYALVIWRSRGVVPRQLRLIYLGDGSTVSYAPDEGDLRATERQLEALWGAISLAHDTGEWLPQPGPQCSWCSFRDLCPEFGGTPPPLPALVASEPAGFTR